ncbi:MAG: hypothetical protein ACJAZY_001826 [Spirosomataceae bacterium]
MGKAFSKDYIVVKMLFLLIIIFHLVRKLELTKAIFIGYDYNPEKKSLSESYFLVNPPRDKEALLKVVEDHNYLDNGFSVNEELNFYVQYFYCEDSTFNRWCISGFFNGGIDPFDVVTDSTPFRDRLVVYITKKNPHYKDNEKTLPSYLIHFNINQIYRQMVGKKILPGDGKNLIQLSRNFRSAGYSILLIHIYTNYIMPFHFWFTAFTKK